MKTHVSTSNHMKTHISTASHMHCVWTCNAMKNRNWRFVWISQFTSQKAWAYKTAIAVNKPNGQIFTELDVFLCCMWLCLQSHYCINVCSRLHQQNTYYPWKQWWAKFNLTAQEVGSFKKRNHHHWLSQSMGLQHTHTGDIQCIDPRLGVVNTSHVPSRRFAKKLSTCNTVYTSMAITTRCITLNKYM